MKKRFLFLRLIITFVCFSIYASQQSDLVKVDAQNNEELKALEQIYFMQQVVNARVHGADTTQMYKEFKVLLKSPLVSVEVIAALGLQHSFAKELQKCTDALHMKARNLAADERYDQSKKEKEFFHSVDKKRTHMRLWLQTNLKNK